MSWTSSTAHRKPTGTSDRYPATRAPAAHPDRKVNQDHRKASENRLTINFEQSLQRLKEIAERLEAEDTKLNEAMELFEEGVKLARSCQDALRLAEQKVQALTEQDGSVTARELNEGQQEGEE